MSFYKVNQPMTLRKDVIFTVCNSSCRKVMFSQACVKNSVHEGGGVHGRGVCGGGMCSKGGACMTVGCALQGEGGMCGRVHAWQGDIGGVHGRGACVAGRGVRGRRDGHCSGQYASNWNAFLLFIV